MWFLHELKSNPTKNFKFNVISLHSNSHSWETLHSLQSFEKLGRSNFHGQLFSDKKPRSRDDNLSLKHNGVNVFMSYWNVKSSLSLTDWIWNLHLKVVLESWFLHHKQYSWNAYRVPSIGQNVSQPKFQFVFAHFLS